MARGLSLTNLTIYPGFEHVAHMKFERTHQKSFTHDRSFRPTLRRRESPPGRRAKVSASFARAGLRASSPPGGHSSVQFVAHGVLGHLKGPKSAEDAA